MRRMIITGIGLLGLVLPLSHLLSAADSPPAKQTYPSLLPERQPSAAAPADQKKKPAKKPETAQEPKTESSLKPAVTCQDTVGNVYKEGEAGFSSCYQASADAAKRKKEAEAAYPNSKANEAQPNGTKPGVSISVPLFNTGGGK